MPMNCSARRRNILILVAVSTRLMAAPAIDSPVMYGEGPAPVSTASEASDEEKPSEVKPPREPRSRGSELSFLVGLGGLPTASYKYQTRVTLPSAGEFQYSGRQRAPGIAAFVGAAFTLPRRLRRITLAGTIGVGGVDSTSQPVIPSGMSPPFSKESLDSNIQDRYSKRLPWRAVLSSYVEHDIGVFHDKRIRAGYQFWNQPGMYTGSFAAAGLGASADYNVRLSLQSHLFRISVNDYNDLQDERDRSRRAGRRSGMMQQWGLLLGSHKTIMLFAGIGPFCQIAH